MVKYATNTGGAMLLLNLIQVTESISGSVVPLAMFFWYRFRDFFPVPIFSDTGSATTKKWKIPGTGMSHSVLKKRLSKCQRGKVPINLVWFNLYIGFVHWPLIVCISNKEPDVCMVGHCKVTVYKCTGWEGWISIFIQPIKTFDQISWQVHLYTTNAHFLFSH